MSANQVKADIYKAIDDTVQTDIPILITGKDNNAVMISQEYWNAIEETLYLNSIPNMANSIQISMNAPDSEFSNTVEWYSARCFI